MIGHRKPPLGAQTDATLRRKVFERDGGRCADCDNVSHPWEVDHIFPLWLVDPRERPRRYWSLGNLQTLCVPCHINKTAREAKDRAKVKRIRSEKRTKMGQKKKPKTRRPGLPF